MPASNPSPPPDATGTVRGLVNFVAQTFAGVKTFTSLLVASAGVQVGSLFNTNGTGASDVGVKVGVSMADASVNSTAGILSARTGIGGVEVEYFRVEKQSFIVGNVALSTNYLRIRSFGGSVWFGVTGQNLTVENDLGGVYFRLLSGGRIDQSGTDSTGTPGNATINKPTGKSAIALGAASVVVTNSLVTAASRVLITPHARDATCKELIAVPAAGSFTVSGTANATAALPFSWEVSTIL